MRATLIYAARDIRLEDVADPVIGFPTDAIVRIVASCVCGSDLWQYRGVQPTTEPHRTGHEFVGIIEEVGIRRPPDRARRLRDRPVRHQRRDVPQLPERQHHLV